MREFSKIAARLWDSRRFTRLSDDGKLFYFYVQTNRQCNSIGCFRLPIGYAVTDLGAEAWPAERAIAVRQEVVDSTLIDLYEDEDLVRIDLFLQFNPITNSRHAAGAAKLALQLPDCALKATVIKELMVQEKIPDQPMFDAFQRALQALSRVVPTETETETGPREEQTKTEIENQLGGKGLGSVHSVSPQGGDNRPPLQPRRPLRPRRDLTR